MTDTFSHFYPKGFVGCASYDQVFGGCGYNAYDDACYVRDCTYWRNGQTGRLWHELIHDYDVVECAKQDLYASMMDDWDKYLEGLSEEERWDAFNEDSGPDGQELDALWSSIMHDPSWVTPVGALTAFAG